MEQIERKAGMMQQKSTGKKMALSTLTKIALLAAVAGVLMLFEAPLWFAPSFYKLDLSELAVMVGALSMGPAAGAMIELIKILLNFVLNGTITGGVGEFANFLIGCSFVVPAAWIYRRQRNIKGMAAGHGCRYCVYGAVGFSNQLLHFVAGICHSIWSTVGIFYSNGQCIESCYCGFKNIYLICSSTFQFVKRNYHQCSDLFALSQTGSAVGTVIP